MSDRNQLATLKRRKSEFSDTFYQLKVLSKSQTLTSDHSFTSALQSVGQYPLKPHDLEIFQINIGKLCNQTCAHCHVDAGPDRKEENMSRETLEKCLEIIQDLKVAKVDITGGAPEMNPHFRWFVESCSSLGVHVMNRCNLTILKAHRKYQDLPEFFADNQVQVISSLPYFTKVRTDRQRGDGVFEKSIEALRDLNGVGYGMEGSGLELDLVYNPSGAFLPGSQENLEAEFKRQLARRYDIHFNRLYVITNLPISRFLEYLIETGNYNQYMTELIEAFNPATVNGLMCRNTLSVSWDGYLYDCDFNQMLDIKVKSASRHINDFDIAELSRRTIETNQHCYGCTAGAGSSCGGEIS
jgi:radical SAM/Cys-rich protein